MDKETIYKIENQLDAAGIYEYDILSIGEIILDGIFTLDNLKEIVRIIEAETL